MTDCLIVIPARYGSTRFHGKVLAKLKGRTVLERCWRAAVAAKLGPVLVATENKIVVEAVTRFGGRAVMTPEKLTSGTDRVYAAAKKERASFIINLQGDEPLIKASVLRAVYRVLKSNPDCDIATAVFPLKDKGHALSPHVVKAALAQDGRALYFSRSLIPYPRNGGGPSTYEHMGIYGFKRKSLQRFVKLKPSPLEKMESLEQLRALENGMTIYAAVGEGRPTAVDTAADLRACERYLASAGRS